MTIRSSLQLLPLAAAAAALIPLTATAAPTKTAPAKRPAAPAKTAKTAKTPTKAPAKNAAKTPGKTSVVHNEAVRNHEKYPGFMELLNKMAAEDMDDFHDAFMYILNATGGNELAVSEWMQEAALSDNAAAKRWVIAQNLAFIVPENRLSAEVKNAFLDISKLADRGFVPARLDTSACLRMGIGCEPDENGAVRQLMEASKGGNILARYQWLVYTKRLTQFEDKDKPEVASEIERGNHHVTYHLSTLAPDSIVQMAWIKRAAEQGSATAYYVLSSLASAKHPKESYTLLNEAVRLHHPDALGVLGSALIEQTPSNPLIREAGVVPDQERGHLLLKTAALLGNPHAAFTLANAYHEGKLGLPKDDTKAFFHVSNPQVSANTACTTARALMLLRGIGTKQDTAQALSQLKRAAATGYPVALIHTAYAHFKGLGVPEDARAAVDLLVEAAAQGYPEAYVYAAFITAKGGKNLSANVAQAQRYVKYATMDMGDRAQQIYDSLILKGDWDPHL